jgi:hypothetical protein
VQLFTWQIKNQNNMNLIGSTQNPVSVTQEEPLVFRKSAFDRARELAAEMRKNNPPAAPRKSIFDRTRELAAEIRKNNPPPASPSASPNPFALARNRAQALAKKNLNNNPASAPSMMPQSAPGVVSQQANIPLDVQPLTPMYTGKPTEPPTAENKNNKMLLLGAGVLAAAGIVYAMTRKKSKK